MSDAKSAAEIEDILSSIRRLVSQDRKSDLAQAAAPAAQRPQIVSRLVVEDRLILTPDQRVAPKAGGAKVTPLRPGNRSPRAEADPAPAQGQKGARPQFAPAEFSPAEFARPDLARPAGAGPMTSGPAPKAPVTKDPVIAGAEASPLAGPSQTPAKAAQALAPQVSKPEAPHPAPSRSAPSTSAPSQRPLSPPPAPVSKMSLPQSAGQRLVLSEPEAQSAEPRQAAPDQPGRLHLDSPLPTPDALAWESETGDPAPDLSSLDWSSFTFARRPMAETYAARSRAADRLAAERSPAPEALAPEALAPEALAPEARAPHAPAVEPASPAAAAPAVQPGFRPAAAEEDAFHLRQRPSAAEDLTAAPLPSPDCVEEPALQEEDSIFSEDVLRELVRDLIREQLQGDLGERITRNIRKLVKAEIARAITLQDQR